MTMKAAKRLIVLCACIGALAACANPAPRSYADPGVPQQQVRGSQNAPYYTGSDPSYQRGFRSSP